MSYIVKNLVIELPKSPLPAGYATEGDEFTFFVSGPKPLECDKYIIDGEAIVLSTGGNAAVHYGKGKFSYSTDCWALQPVEKDIEGKYLYYFLSSQIDRINALGFEGSGLKHLRKDFIRNYEVPDLSIPEQSKIAEVLSKVDQAIEQTESLIAKQQRIKTGLMQDILTRGIDEHGNLRSEETHEFKDSPLGRIPVEWECKELGDCAYITKLAGFEFTNYFDYKTGGEIIALRALNIKHERLDLTDIQRLPKVVSDKLPRSKIFAGDILITYIGAYIGDVLRIEESDKYHLAPNIAKIVSGNRLHSDYLEIFLRSEAVQRQIRNLTAVTATPSLTMTQIRKLIIAFPKKKEEQERLTLRIRAMSKTINSVSSELLKFRSLKTALMQDLLTGKKRVTPLMKSKEVFS